MEASWYPYPGRHLASPLNPANRIGFEDPETDLIDRSRRRLLDFQFDVSDDHFLTARWDPVELAHDQSGDGVEISLLGQLQSELLIELRRWAVPVDASLVFADSLDRRRFGDVGFVLNLTDDLLEYVFDRHDSRNGLVLVVDDCHVHAPLEELPQHDIESSRLGYVDRLPQQSL